MISATRLKPAMAALPALLLAACLVRDKPDKALGAGGLTPPWSPVRFEPKRLEGFAFAGPESLFAVFEGIARIDSLSGDPRTWLADPEAANGPSIGQMLDTAFVFPGHAESEMPYGYDDSFRDDTLFRRAYGHGLFTQDQPCAETVVLSGNFLHPARWLRAGLRPEYLIETLGKPAYSHPGVLRYLSHAPAGEAGDTLNHAAGYNEQEIFEGVNLYFHDDSLFAAVLQKSRPCH